MVVNELKNLTKPQAMPQEKTTLSALKKVTASTQAPINPSLQISVKDKVLVAILKVQLSNEFVDVIDSLQELK